MASSFRLRTFLLRLALTQMNFRSHENLSAFDRFELSHFIYCFELLVSHLSTTSLLSHSLHSLVFYLFAFYTVWVSSLYVCACVCVLCWRGKMNVEAMPGQSAFYDAKAFERSPANHWMLSIWIVANSSARQIDQFDETIAIDWLCLCGSICACLSCCCCLCCWSFLILTTTTSTVQYKWIELTMTTKRKRKMKRNTADDGKCINITHRLHWIFKHNQKFQIAFVRLSVYRF